MQIKRAVYYSKVKGPSKDPNEIQKRPLLRMFSFTSSGSRSSGSFKFSRSSLRSTLSKTSNTNPGLSSNIKTKGQAKDKQENNNKEEDKDDFEPKPMVKMQHLQKPEHMPHRRSAMNRRRCDLSSCNVNIPTTINEESSRGSKTPSPCAERPRVRAIIEKNMSEDELCSCSLCQCQCSGIQCTCDDFKGLSCDDSCQDSGGSDAFCETCADAGLVECCHITPEPKIRMALLKTLQTDNRTTSNKDRSHKAENIPVITFDHYH